MQTALVLTLGHGSSAIFIESGQVKCGYQNERLSGIKGDSRFPALAIERVLQECDVPSDLMIYVSHWEPTGNVDKMTIKHWNREYLSQRFPKADIVCTSTMFTHHDAHAYSALAYNYHAEKPHYIVVADGFGTLGEVLSIYMLESRGVRRVKRCYGYSNSLGLLYQYATDYVGLKMNQDEYKLNAMANRLSTSEAPDILELAMDKADELLMNLDKSTRGGADDPIVSINALSYVHKQSVDFFESHFGPDQRPQIAFFLQSVVEIVLEELIEKHCVECKDITFVGGCFLNVQLNGHLAKCCDSISVMPLSGDEGAGLGLYTRYNPNFVIPDDLNWGLRTLHPTVAQSCADGIIYVPKNRFAGEIEQHLKEDKIVNVVRGAMEYGPRAYCNTSTLALPTIENRSYINKLNNRHDAMPMCPVMTSSQFIAYCKWSTCYKRSVEHMIVAISVLDEWVENIPYDQTRGYVKRVLRSYYAYQLLY